MTVKHWGNEFRLTTVCVDSYDNGELCGRFYNPYLKDAVNFKSLSQFIIQMENMLNSMNLPQSFTAVRTFSPSASDIHSFSSENESKSSSKGELATFALRVIFRQHTSWQGSVSWLEAKKEQSFRSVLELILLLDSALCSAVESSGKNTVSE
ncbi:MAG: hypothetical protein Q4C14_05335 [Bacillota bacterium]|nr:hypothetical protein [Bacillota bacterium]